MIVHTTNGLAIILLCLLHICPKSFHTGSRCDMSSVTVSFQFSKYSQPQRETPWGFPPPLFPKELC